MMKPSAMDHSIFSHQLSLISETFRIDSASEEYYIDFLMRTNYQRLLPYIRHFTKSACKTFCPPTGKPDFASIKRIYELDTKLRVLIFEIIEDIEIYLRTRIMSYISARYSEKAYLSASIFSSRHMHNSFLGRLRRTVEENEDFFRNTKLEHIPLSVIIEFFSIGMLSYFYSDLKSQDQKWISRTLYDTTPVHLESWMRCLTDIRNKCAHYSRMYNWIFSSMPKLPSELKFQAERGIFTQILVLRLLHPNPEKWAKKFIPKFLKLFHHFSEHVDLALIGFPSDWQTLIQKPDCFEEMY